MDVKKAARDIAKLGHGNDQVLAHINKDEAAMLSQLFGHSINKHTGLPQFGWLQDWSSDFSLKHLNPIETFSDPHKALTQWATKGFQRTVGPIAAKFIPVVGPYLSAAGSAWNAHEQSNPSSANYKAPDSSPASQATQAAAISQIPTSSSSSSSGSMLGGLGALFGGGGASSGGSNTQTAALQQQVQQLKQQIQQHYEQQGAGDSDQAKADQAKVDAWAQAQAQQATKQGQQVAAQQQSIQQEAAA